jgi:hypothetical protein
MDMVIFDKRKDKGADGRAGKEGQLLAGHNANTARDDQSVRE